MDTNTPTLTEEEKKYLESYKEENPFLKSLSDFYKERAMLSEKQILALRKESESHKIFLVSGLIKSPSVDF